MGEKVGEKWNKKWEAKWEEKEQRASLQVQGRPVFSDPASPPMSSILPLHEKPPLSPIFL